MKPFESEIEEFFNKLKACDKVNNEHKQRLRQEVLKEHSRAKAKDSLVKVGICSFLLKSRGLKVAAAAVVIATIGLVVLKNFVAVDMATPAFGKIAEALSKSKWIHEVQIRRVQYKGRTEYWSHYDSNGKMTIRFTKERYGDIRSTNFITGIINYYHAESNTRIITYQPLVQYIQLIPNPKDSVAEWIREFESYSTGAKYERGTYRGRDVDIYILTDYLSKDDKQLGDITEQQHKYKEFEFVVDRENYLPLRIRFRYWMKGSSQNTDMDTDREKEFYYPESGPKDICELGVPEDAEIYENLPSEKLLATVRNIVDASEANPLKYTAVEVRSTLDKSSEKYKIGEVDVFYSDGDRQRSVCTHLNKISSEEFERDTDGTVNSVLDWLEREVTSGKRVIKQTSRLYSAKWTAWLQRFGGQGRWEVSYRKENVRKAPRGHVQLGHYIAYRDVLSEMGWTPRDLDLASGSSWDISIAQDDYAEQRGLICIRVHGNKRKFGTEEGAARIGFFYFDPQHDFICCKEDISRPGLGETKKFREVLEYAQLESGHWYPHKILLKTTYKEPDGRVLEGQKTITVYVDTVRGISEDIFSPDYLLEQQVRVE